MGRRAGRKQDKVAYIDLSELGTNSTLLEDLRFYVGSPHVYVPKVWDVCVSTLRRERRIILNERDNADVLDGVWNDFHDDFDQNKFSRIVRDHHLSVRRDGYQDNVSHFYYEVFEIMYPQVAATVDRLSRASHLAAALNFTCEVDSVRYEVYNDGFGELERELGVDVIVKSENYLTTNQLLGEGYER